jgi:MFS family permease
LLPVAARDLDGVVLYPLVAGAFVAASLLGGVLGGTWADRADARRPLMAGVVLTVVTLLVSATSTTIWQLALGRFTDGIAAGLVAVSVNVAIGESYPDHVRARALALMSACWIVPSLAGPPLAGLVTAWWSWRAVFFGLAGLTLLPAVAAVLLLRGQAPQAGTSQGTKKPETPVRRPTLPAAVAVSAAAALTQYGVSAWDVRHVVCTVSGLALLVLFAPRLLPPHTVRAGRGLPATVLLRALTSGAYFTLEAFVPLMLSTARRVPGVVTGLAFTGAALAWAGASWLQGRLQDRVPRHRLVAVGAGVMAAAVALAVLCHGRVLDGAGRCRHGTCDAVVDPAVPHTRPGRRAGIREQRDADLAEPGPDGRPGAVLGPVQRGVDGDHWSTRAVRLGVRATGAAGRGDGLPGIPDADDEPGSATRP